MLQINFQNKKRERERLIEIHKDCLFVSYLKFYMSILLKI